MVMIANINPNGDFYEDSHNTLKYANRAKSIQASPRRTARRRLRLRIRSSPCSPPPPPAREWRTCRHRAAAAHVSRAR